MSKESGVKMTEEEKFRQALIREGAEGGVIGRMHQMATLARMRPSAVVVERTIDEKDLEDASEPRRPFLGLD